MLIRDLVLIPIFFIGIALLLNDLLILLNTELKITDQNIYVSTRVRSNHRQKQTLANITGVAIDQGFFGKFFDYGTIIICTESDSIIVRHINNPEQLKKKLNSAIDKINSN